MMVHRRLSRIVAAVLAAATYAPAQNSLSLVEDLVELRAEVGSGAVATDGREFAEAVRQVAEDSPQYQRQHLTERYLQNAPRETGRDRPHADPRGWNGLQPMPAPQAQPPGWVGPPPYHPGRHSRPTLDPPKHLLLESAFELEKIAHHLEMADFGKEADAVRDAAGKLRRSARDSKTDKPSDAKDRRDKRGKQQSRAAAETKRKRMKQAMDEAKAAKLQAERAKQEAQRARKVAE